MARGTASLVIEAAVNREPGLVKIQIGQNLANACRVQQDRVIALPDHRVAAARKGVALAVGMYKIDDAALRVHDVVVQVLFQAFPQLQRMRVKFRVAGQHVIGPDDGGIAPDIATAKIAFFENGNIAQPMHLGQVMRRCQTMATAANQHDVIFCLGFGVAPVRSPSFVSCQAFLKNPEP